MAYGSDLSFLHFAPTKIVFGAGCSSELQRGVFSGVQPDSSLAICNEGARVARGLGADALVSLGGGSSIDTVKAMRFNADVAAEAYRAAGTSLGICNPKPVTEAAEVMTVLRAAY